MPMATAATGICRIATNRMPRATCPPRQGTEGKRVTGKLAAVRAGGSTVPRDRPQWGQKEASRGPRLSAVDAIQRAFSRLRVYQLARQSQSLPRHPHGSYSLVSYIFATSSQPSRNIGRVTPHAQVPMGFELSRGAWKIGYHEAPAHSTAGIGTAIASGASLGHNVHHPGRSPIPGLRRPQISLLRLWISFERTARSRLGRQQTFTNDAGS